MNVLSEIEKLRPDMQKWRRDIHAHPETAFEEKRTSDLVAARLAEFGLKVHRGLAKTGVVGVLKNEAETHSGSIGLRADMDALHIQEKNDFAHRSQVPGKMHACGHDGHTSMLLGAAAYLARTRNFKGTVYFIFQPAEENEGGGEVMVQEGLFEKFNADAVFGLHNWPGVDAGVIGLRSGPMMASFDSFEIEVIGKGSHAAMPHLGRDAVLAAAELTQALQKIVSRQTDPMDNVVVSVTQIHAGDTWNIIPERALIRGTVRCFKAEVQDEVEKSFERICAGICGSAQVDFKLDYRRRYPATINTVKETEFAAGVAREVVGDENVLIDIVPSMGSEDFSFMLQKKPGCYVRLGNGPGEGGCILHSPDYDFNDDILTRGAAYFARLAEKFLGQV